MIRPNLENYYNRMEVISYFLNTHYNFHNYTLEIYQKLTRALIAWCEQRVRGASEISKFLRDTIVSVVIFWNLHLY